MYIISILNVSTCEVELTTPFNDELEAQNHFLDKVSELSKNEKNLEYESIILNKTKACIYKKEIGWVKNYKEQYKIVTLHHESGYDIMER